MEWLTRMQDALSFIEDHITNPLGIEEVAQAAYSSPFHFQRMFRMLTGVSVGEYIRRRRLTLAAQELAVTQARVLDVALKYGYESPEAFAKAFRKAHGITPSAAREPDAQLKAYPRLSFQLSLKGDQDMDYRIVTREAFTVTGKTLVTSCVDGENSREIPAFWNTCNADGTSHRLAQLGGGEHDLLGICADMNAQGDEFTYWIAVEADLPDEEGLSTRVIPAATWAVFTAVGPMPGAIQEVWQRIFQEWFPSTGYEHTGGPEFELYPPDDPFGEDYRTEIWVPVQMAART
ncbi:AraC family transcriptional regulator [Paenibacillus daejeonensis]|uniref:AraC family transcriptional regulator n=1 Tax=Paenibacillus daejeonensis TaxID=135193 RepID=UPI0003725432|nr:AraC family transcriptional regulator [Paenibacillus daejeonensis]